MSFEVLLSFAGKAHPAVPALAVLWDREGSYVYKARDDRAVRTDISIVARMDGQVLVNGDLQQGDLVVSEGANSVRPNLPFRTPDSGVSRDVGA